MYSNVGYTSFGGFAPSASVVGYAPKSDISYDTSSKDPVAVRARVFVGNLNTSRVTRDDVIQLFRPYGTLAGVTLFKGYCFVQYSNAPEADMSVAALANYNWNGSVLDVKLAGGPPGAPAAGKSGSSTNTLGSKRALPDVFFGAKRVRPEQANNQNKAYAAALEEVPTVAEHASSADTLICGECRFITQSIGEYVEHKKKPCTFFKAEGEPFKLQCFTCTDEFGDSWSLVQHLTATHKLVLYKEPLPESEPTNGDEGHEEEKVADSPEI